MKAVGVVLIVLGIFYVVYCGMALSSMLITYGVLSACLGFAMMVMGRKLWRG